MEDSPASKKPNEGSKAVLAVVVFSPGCASLFRYFFRALNLENTTDGSGGWVEDKVIVSAGDSVERMYEPPTTVNTKIPTAGDSMENVCFLPEEAIQQRRRYIKLSYLRRDTNKLVNNMCDAWSISIIKNRIETQENRHHEESWKYENIGDN